MPKKSAARLTTSAGGWYHIANAFDADRFESARIKSGAPASRSACPASPRSTRLNASLRYLDQFGVDAIAAHADPLVARVHEGLRELGHHAAGPRAAGDARAASSPSLHKHTGHPRRACSLKTSTSCTRWAASASPCMVTTPRRTSTRCWRHWRKPSDPRISQMTLIEIAPGGAKPRHSLLCNLWTGNHPNSSSAHPAIARVAAVDRIGVVASDDGAAEAAAARRAGHRRDADHRGAGGAGACFADGAEGARHRGGCQSQSMGAEGLRKRR
jgi:hypothetical protein